jgi:hypothetical protein
MLVRRSHSDGGMIGAKIGWNDVSFDAYFLRLARLICDVLKTDRAIMHASTIASLPDGKSGISGMTRFRDRRHLQPHP